MDSNPGGLIDAGVNLVSTQFQADIDDVLLRAQQAGLSHLLAIGTDLPGSSRCIALCRQYAGYVVATAGIHPHCADGADADTLNQLRDLIACPEVVAVGEMGLDFNRNFSTTDNQLRVFEAQLQLAGDSNKPVYLHERDAFAAQIALLRNYRKSLSGGLVHCFTGDKAQVRAYLDLDFYIGITGWVCDPRRGEELREAAAYIPRDRLVLETDAPYLLPRHLGKSELALIPQRRRNEPCLLPQIAAYLAELLACPVDELIATTAGNTRKLFGLHPNPAA
jgi:TatD DNase family protein